MRLSLAKVIYLIVLAFSIGLGFTDDLSAQDKPMSRKYGLTASIQGGQGTILIPLWLGNKLTLAPGVGLNYVKNGTTNLTLMLAPRFYLDMRRIAPYLSLQGSATLNMPKVGGNTTNATIGAGFGGEYFLNAMFSFGVEAQLNVSITDVGGANGLAASTSAGVHANVYF